MYCLGDLFREIKHFTDCPVEHIEAAYWWLTEHHPGAHSWEYRALCRLSRVYSPGLHRPLGNFTLNALT